MLTYIYIYYIYILYIYIIDIYNISLSPLVDISTILPGQDPYHEPGQAHGMCFSVQPGIKTPPSLANIYKAPRAWTVAGAKCIGEQR